MGSFQDTPAAMNYLESEIFPLHQKWCLAWVDQGFHALLIASSPSESFHSLLAGGDSAHRTHAQLIKKIDSILADQVVKHQQRAVSHDKALQELEENDLQGLVVVSVAPLLSGYAFNHLMTLRCDASFMSVHEVAPGNVLHTRQWTVRDARFRNSRIHRVGLVDLDCVPESAEMRGTAALIEGALSIMSIDLDVCGICGGGEGDDVEPGVSFVLPKQWPKLYSTKPQLIQLCRALGFREPKETSGPSNSNNGSLIAMIQEYETQMHTLMKECELKDALRGARDYMRKYLFNGSPLGIPNYQVGENWMYCGLLEGEDSVPKEFKRQFCGHCMHLECAGFVRVPRVGKDRIPCIRCASDLQYRPKDSQLVTTMQNVCYLAKTGKPRITHLNHNPGEEIGTLLLDCDCRQAVGAGLPCPAMVAVGQMEGSVLSFRLYHKYWFSHKLIGAPDPLPAFDINKKQTFDKEAVIGSMEPRVAPSAMQEGQPLPKKSTVSPSTGAGSQSPVHFSRGLPGGGPVSNDERLADLQKVLVQGRNQKKKSRRYKQQSKKL